MVTGMPNERHAAVSLSSESVQIPSPLLFAVAALLIHLAGNPHYGFFRDELYFIMCGFRPAWGYVDQPPIAPLLAAGSQILGHALFLLRAVPALFAAGSIYITCLIAIEFGGGVFAQGLAAVAALFCPVLMNFGMKLSTDMVGLVLWPLTTLWIMRAISGRHPHYWILAGLAIGLAFQAKYSIVFFALGLLAGLLLTPQRRALLNGRCVGGVLIAALVALPNVLWQLHFDFPVLELLKNGQAGKNVILSPSGFMVAQLLITNPILSLIWLSGLIFLARTPSYRFLAMAFLVLMAEMIGLHGKHYYPANVYPVLMAAGAVAIEAWTAQMRAARPWIVAAASLAGLIMMPYAMPVLPASAFLAYNRVVGPILHLEGTKTETHGDGPLPQDWADMHGWPELAATVADVYRSLSAVEQANAVIVASNYGQAAAIEFFGADEGLPPVISGHNQYYLWGTRGKTGDVMIDVNGNCGKEIGLFQSSVVAATFTHPYVMPYESHVPIMVCRGINKPLADIWEGIRYYR